MLLASSSTGTQTSSMVPGTMVERMITEWKVDLSLRARPISAHTPFTYLSPTAPVSSLGVPTQMKLASVSSTA